MLNGYIHVLNLSKPFLALMFEIDTDFRGHLSTMGITRMPGYMLT